MNFDFSALNFETIDSNINAYPDMFLNQNERTAFRRAQSAKATRLPVHSRAR